MKKYFTMLIILTVILISSIAMAWRADANVLVHPLLVKATVVNQLPYPIACNGKVFGKIASGHVGWAWFNAIIPPGMSAYAYVNTNANNPFYDGWSNIHCSSH